MIIPKYYFFKIMKLVSHVAKILFGYILTVTVSLNAQEHSGFIVQDEQENLWVDSVYHSLSPDERIAQLIMVRSFSNRGQKYTDSLATVLARYNIGGVIFFKGTPSSQVQMTNHFQEAVKTPLLVAMDAEWGLAMRLDSVISFPRQLALGAIEDDILIYEMGAEIGRQLKRLGVHINFAPVVDVNVNPLNPVINSRSFGENKLFVAHKSLSYMKGLQNMGIISVAKHFPGHGDTDKDSHFTLPLISKPFHEIDSIHLFPFKYLIGNGLTGVMSAHLAVPAIDPDHKSISSLSPLLINQLLKKDLGFNGLVFTDGLEMKAIADFVPADSVEIKALIAGNDILLLPLSVPVAIRNIKKAVEKGIIPDSLIEEKCRKVLAWKFRVGLASYQKTDTENLYGDLNSPGAELLNRRLTEASLTILNNQENLLPIRRPDTLIMASLEIGNPDNTTFTGRLKNYADVTGFVISKTAPAAKFNELLNTLANYQVVFVCLRNTGQNPADYGISSQTRTFIHSLSVKVRVVLVLAGNPYSLSLFDQIERLNAIMVTYHDTDMGVDLAAQALFGAFKVSGELPVSIGDVFSSGDGMHTNDLQRLKYTIPEEVGIESSWLQKVNFFALKGIAERAYPGCRVLAAFEGKVIYDNSFGYHTYDRKRKVQSDDIYDVASLTKIAATTLAVMKLYGEGKLDIDQRISHYLTELKNTDKKRIIIRDVMTHQANLQAWIPFYKQLLKNGVPDPSVFSSKKHGDFTIEVAKDLFMDKRQVEKIYDSIAAAPLIKRRGYLYSDLGFYWLKQVVERLTGIPLDEYVEENFYKPLGLNNTTFNPHKRFEPEKLVPTENDREFRKQLLQGYVHDPGAAMLGGVGGHAGLFSTAGDMAVVMQMLMNKGSYGGIRYFTPQVLSEFTRTQFPLNDNRRGLGFDKPQLVKEDDGPTSIRVSNSSFGHSGFTGVYAWADPKYHLVYIFLSNRVHPLADNAKISTLNIRTNIHQVFYEALEMREKKAVERIR